MRIWRERLAALVFGLLFTWLLLELVLRIGYGVLPYALSAPLRDVRVHPFTETRILPPPVWFDDSSYQLVTRPNIDDEFHYPDPRVGFHISTKNWLDPNSTVGFRVPSVDWEPPWPIDAVFVGDSFTFCYVEYDDCWVRLLETEHSLSTVNLGLVATGGQSRFNVLNTFGLPYQPRIVIWQWYGNDFNDDFGHASKYGELADPDTESPDSDERDAGWWAENSAVIALGRAFALTRQGSDSYTRFQDQYLVETDAGPIAVGQPYILEAFDLTLEKNRVGRGYTEEVMLLTQQRLAEQGIELVIVMMPSKEEVYGAWTEEALGRGTLENLSQGRLEMAEFCSENRLRCLDLAAPLTQAAEAGELVYYADDTHINPAGNRIAAEAVHAFLESEGLLD